MKVNEVRGTCTDNDVVHVLYSIMGAIKKL
jgi:hypothetical protein